jgi:hypothetical protein
MYSIIKEKNFKKRKESHFKLFLVFSLIFSFGISFSVVWGLNTLSMRSSQSFGEVKGTNEALAGFENNNKNITLSNFDLKRDNVFVDSSNLIQVEIPANTFWQEQNQAEKLILKIEKIPITKESKIMKNVLGNTYKSKIATEYLYSLNLNIQKNDKLETVNIETQKDKVVTICVNLSKLETNDFKSFNIKTSQNYVNFLENDKLCIKTNQLLDFLILQKV